MDDLLFMSDVLSTVFYPQQKLIWRDYKVILAQVKAKSDCYNEVYKRLSLKLNSTLGGEILT